jgi:hypothetical protein
MIARIAGPLPCIVGDHQDRPYAAMISMPRGVFDDPLGCEGEHSSAVHLRSIAGIQRQTIEEIDDAGLERILSAHHQEPILLDQLFEKLRSMS